LSKKPTVFVREATGLVKNVSFLDAITLNISNMSAGAALGIVGFTMVLLPSISGANLVYGSILAFLLSIPQVIVYTMMTRRIPRTGGDYVWISRTFGGFWGSSLAFMGYTLETMAYLALISLSAVMAIGSVGVSLGYQSLLALALPGNISGSSPTSQFVLGTIIFAVLIAINIVKPKAGYRLVSILSIIGILATLAGIFVLLGAGQGGVQSYMDFLNSIGAKGTYASVAGSYSGSTFDFGATIFLLPFFAIFVYPWINAAPAVASEVKGKNTIKWNVPIASIIVFLIVTASFATMYYVGGFAFTNAALANPTLVYDYSFNFWTLAMGVSSNVALSWFIGIGWILWNIAILAYGIIVVSRYIFAQAFDRFLPSQLAYVSPKYGSPVVAHLIDLVVTIFLIGGAAFLYGTLSSLFGAVVASMIYFIIIGLAAAAYGLRKEKGGAQALLVVAGILMALVFVYITYQFLAFPSVWGGNTFAYGYVVVTFILGAGIYLASKAYHSGKGIDISLVYKEIPPE
jgi:amino acid transporter